MGLKGSHVQIGSPANLEPRPVLTVASPVWDEESDDIEDYQ